MSEWVIAAIVGIVQFAATCGGIIASARYLEHRLDRIEQAVDRHIHDHLLGKV
jgi:hypothetical protein